MRWSSGKKLQRNGFGNYPERSRLALLSERAYRDSFPTFCGAAGFSPSLMEGLWCETVEKVTVHSEGDIVVIFKDVVRCVWMWVEARKC